MQQLYAFLVPQRAPAPAGAAGVAQQAGQQAPGQPQQQPLPHAPSTAGLTEYEREMLAATGGNGQGQKQPQAGGAPAGVTPQVVAAAAKEKGRHFGASLRAWLRQSLR